MRIEIRGHDLPGRSCGHHTNVHVAVQVGQEPVGLVPADAPAARWEIDVRRVDGDLRGPGVHGRRGERFAYLTWGEVDPDGTFSMFRRAKVMLDRVDSELVARADREDRPLVADVHLTDDLGNPRCARVDPPAISWTIGPGTGSV